MPFVRGWLAIAYTAARPLVRLHVAPTTVTLGGVVLAGAAVPVAGVGGRWCLAAAVVVLVSALFDSLDGTVAVLSDRVSRWGALVDALADRLADLAYGLAVWVVGAPAWLVIGWVGLGWLAEYTRARAQGIGGVAVDVVTVGERPTRIAVTIFTMLGCGVVPAWVSGVSTVGAAVGAAAGIVGLGQLLLAIRRRLA